jgi:SAM-dependent methyltransferase
VKRQAEVAPSGPPAPSAEREAWNQRHRASQELLAEDANEFLTAVVARSRPGRALDLGCGGGRNAVWLARLGWHVVGVDFSEVALERARRLAEGADVQVRWEHADLRDYVPPSGLFDLVLVLYLHLPPAERRLVLGRGVRALAPGGRILVIGHDLSNLSAGYGGPQRPELLYTPETITGELAGVTVERAERVTRHIVEEPAANDAIDTLVIGRRP